MASEWFRFQLFRNFQRAVRGLSDTDFRKSLLSKFNDAALLQRGTAIRSAIRISGLSKVYLKIKLGNGNLKCVYQKWLPKKGKNWRQGRLA